MTLREHLALLVYDIKTGGCLVPFKDQGNGMKKAVNEDVDKLLDILTGNPGAAVLLAGFSQVALEPDVECVGAAFQDMIRAIKEGE